jgi:hypothetical protein
LKLQVSADRNHSSLLPNTTFTRQRQRHDSEHSGKNCTDHNDKTLVWSGSGATTLSSRLALAPSCSVSAQLNICAAQLVVVRMQATMRSAFTAQRPSAVRPAMSRTPTVVVKAVQDVKGVVSSTAMKDTVVVSA